VAWRSEDWIYRTGPGVRAVGCATHAVRTGPFGSLLAGDGEVWLHGAAPGRSLLPLPRPLAVGPWGVRFAPDGNVVAGLDPRGDGVRIDLRAQQVLGVLPALLPLDTESATLDPASGDLVVAGRRARSGLVEASWDVRGAILGGPGGVTWDLSTGEPRFSTPAFRLGAPVPGPDRRATVGREDGAGRWVDPATGARHDPFTLPLQAGDDVASGCAGEDGVVFLTTFERGYLVEGGGVREVVSPEAPVNARTAGPGWRVTRRGLEIERGSERERLSLPVEGALRVGDRLYAWSADGLLIAAAAPF
jgi:hypothetical protein